MMTTPAEQKYAELDRVRELVSIGGGHAASAFANILYRPCRMRVPLVRLLPVARMDTPFAGSGQLSERDLTGVFFGIDGGMGGFLAILFSSDTRRQLLEQLTGRPAIELAESVAESALREFGNILASHVASAIADTIGAVVLPSVPQLVNEDAAAALPALVRDRGHVEPTVRIETEISDRGGRVRALLAFVPDPIPQIAQPGAL